MSSRRGSVVAAAESSAQGSRASTPANSVGGAPSVIDTIVEETEDDVVAAVKRDVVGSRTAVGMTDSDVDETSFIQQHARLDIAFLHAISSHRPLGTHKHFNLIPVLSLLDRAVRQIEADARDQEARDAAEDAEGSDADERGRSNKREDGEPSLFDKDGSQALVITPSMIWQRLEELFDTEGLDELEDQAIDADSDSPFNKRPEPTYASYFTRKALGSHVSQPAFFGFGNKLERLADVPKASTKVDKKTARSKAAAAAASVADDDEDEDAVIVDFELGPWEDYESLIAPRRLAVNAPSEERQGDDITMDEESIPAVARAKKDSSRQQSVSTDASIDGEEGEEEEDGEHQDEEEEEEEEGDEIEKDDEEENEADEEEEEKRPAKRKAAPSSNKKQGPASRQKRSGGSNATASSSATPTRASRSSAAQPRRSTRK